MKIRVEIVETLRKVVIIDSKEIDYLGDITTETNEVVEEEALQLVRDRYYNEDIILDSNDYLDAEITVLNIIKEEC
jgi:hypothetical protein